MIDCLFKYIVCMYVCCLSFSVFAFVGVITNRNFFGVFWFMFLIFFVSVYGFDSLLFVFEFGINVFGRYMSFKKIIGIKISYSV